MPSNIISFGISKGFAVFLIAILLLGIIFLFRKYYQKKRYGGIGWEEYEVKESESVVSLADKVNVNWKVLAKTNNLKAPYLFEAGRIILVPGGFGNVEKNKKMKSHQTYPTVVLVKKKKKKLLWRLKK